MASPFAATTYQPIDSSPNTNATTHSPTDPSTKVRNIATKVQNTASRGGEKNILKSVSNALSKVNDFALKTKNKFIEDFKKHPVSYLAATIAAVGVVVSTFFVPPAAAVVIAGLGLFFMAAVRADEENMQVDRKLRDEFGLVARHPASYLPTGRGPLAGVPIPPSKGVTVHAVTTESPSERAGVLKSDKITAVNGQPVHNKRSLLKALEKAKAEGKTTLCIKREHHPELISLMM